MFKVLDMNASSWTISELLLYVVQWCTPQIHTLESVKTSQGATRRTDLKGISVCEYRGSYKPDRADIPLLVFTHDCLRFYVTTTINAEAFQRHPKACEQNVRTGTSNARNLYYEEFKINA